MRCINLFFILIFCVFSSCSKTDYEKKRDLENKIIKKTWNQLYQEKKLQPVGEGKSITPGKEFLRLIFQYFKPLTIDEARELVVYAAETFLHNLNSNKKLNELIDKPYPMNWILVDIFIFNSDHSHIPPTGISIVKFKRDKIEYITDDLKNYEVIYEETYQEALEKLNN